MTVEKLIDKYYEKLFDELVHSDEVGEDLHDLVIEVKIRNDGKTIRRSWQDRERFIREEDRDDDGE